MQRKRVLLSSWILNECKLSCKIVKNCRIICLNRAKKEHILSEVCMIKKGLIVLFTWDVLRKSMFKRLVYSLYTPPDSSLRFTCKLNLSNAKNPAWFFILASVWDRGMQRVNWLPPRTIVARVLCFLKLYFGVVQLSIVSLTEQCWRDWWMPHYDATANANTIHE